MENNFLKLNDTKTEFIMFGTPKDVGKVVEWTVDVGDAIDPANKTHGFTRVY